MALFLGACADPAPEVISSDRIGASVYATRVNAQEAYCSVLFYLVAEPASNFYLEADSIVACDGVETTLGGGTYNATFPHASSSSIEVSIIRPKAGSTVLEYFPLQ